MHAIEFETEIKNGQLTIPTHLLPELSSYQYGKVVLLLKEKPKPKKLFAHKVKIDNFIMPKREELYES
ncbi:MAG: hypothetical protein WAW36_16745 [Methylovulum miyakonense]|uniref:hypothetical protein n=1 Tax=Methylovulum miyakonense TaxID=645578 RepID=UPI003BB4B7D8